MVQYGSTIMWEVSCSVTMFDFMLFLNLYVLIWISSYFNVLSTQIFFGLIGEIVSVQLPRTITSIWPLPFGLLLQQEVEACTPSRVPFSSTSPLLSVRDMLLSASNHIQKGDGSLVSSHLILMDPLDEQQVCYSSLWIVTEI
jgi:hypothetical protein